jgi:hypothetical protein
MRCWPATAIAAALLAHCAAATAAERSVLDRVAEAVDGAESSHGEDFDMWRPDPSGPQGRMQVTAAAATDVGGGDRFDSVENLAIGRAYLEQLYRRYHNWPVAIAAYNWGIGRVDAWLEAGRPAGKLAKGVAAYTERVLRESGLCGPARPPGRLAEPRFGSRARRRARLRTVSASELGAVGCAEFAGGGKALDAAGKWRRDNPLLVGLVSPELSRRLEAAIQQAAHDLQEAERR